MWELIKPLVADLRSTPRGPTNSHRFSNTFFILDRIQNWQNITRLNRNHKLMEEISETAEEIPEKAVYIADEDLDITFLPNGDR